MRYPIFSLGLMLLMVGCREHGTGHSESDRQAATEQNKAAAMAFASPEFGITMLTRKQLLRIMTTVDFSNCSSRRLGQIHGFAWF
jgi:hypothetical protein